MKQIVREIFLWINSVFVDFVIMLHDFVYLIYPFYFLIFIHPIYFLSFHRPPLFSSFPCLFPLLFSSFILVDHINPKLDFLLSIDYGGDRHHLHRPPRNSYSLSSLRFLLKRKHCYHCSQNFSSCLVMMTEPSSLAPRYS